MEQTRCKMLINELQRCSDSRQILLDSDGASFGLRQSETALSWCWSGGLVETAGEHLWLIFWVMHDVEVTITFREEGIAPQNVEII